MSLDRRERSGELVEAVKVALEGHQAEVWTAMPGILQSFDPAKNTCTVQPALKALATDELGATQWVQLPLLVDCPVQFPAGGGFVMTFPLTVGDEGLVVFASRCIDAWWQNGGIQVQAEMRMHNLSDGFFLPGVFAVPRVPANISTSEVQLRNTAGTNMVRMSATELEMKIGTTGSVKVSDSRVDITGVLWINGARYIDHKHNDPQGGLTGGVVP